MSATLSFFSLDNMNLHVKFFFTRTFSDSYADLATLASYEKEVSILSINMKVSLKISKLLFPRSVVQQGPSLIACPQP